MADRDYLRLVTDQLVSDIDAEFAPLPYYPWEHRPPHLPLEVDEAATALYLGKGIISDAAQRLKVEPLKLTRFINRHPRLTRLHAELVSLLNDDVHREVLSALSDDDARRREWGSSRVMNSRQFQGHPLSPNTQNAPTLSIGGPAKIIISWDDGPPAIDHDPAA
jgi:hypothetical protein